MRPSSARSVDDVWPLRQPERFEVRVTEGGHVVATGSPRRRGTAPGVTVTDESIAATGFHGQFWRPPAGGPRRPAVREFGGSEGGLDGQLVGDALASAGYPTLDIAHSNEPGLPTQLRDIPLAHFPLGAAVAGPPAGGRPRRIDVAGGSRGSEAALLLGVHHPKLVDGVIVSSTSDLSLGSCPAPGSPAWTFRGRPVSYSRALSPFSQVHAPAEIAIQRRLHAAHGPLRHVLYRSVGVGAVGRRLVGELRRRLPCLA